MKKIVTLLVVTALILTGCESDYTILPSANGIILTADRSSRVTGQEITFTTRDNSNNDITSETAFYVNDQPIEGNTFTSEQVGDFVVKAVRLGENSTPITVRFHNGSETNFTKRLLVEDYTGTWCGWCPRISWAIEKLHEQTDDFVAVAIHRPSSNPSSPIYDPYNFDASVLENAIGVAGYPKGMLNRLTEWTGEQPDNLAQPITLTQGENPRLGLALSPAVNGSTLSLDVNVKFSNNFTGLKLVVYVLENGLVYEQHNYTNYYDGIDVLEEFDHNHVLRAALTPLMGDAIDAAQTVTNNTYTKTFSVPIPANVANTANIEFVAFVTDAQGNALNVRKAVAGDVQEFEEY
jgi:hypothetical protein